MKALGILSHEGNEGFARCDLAGSNRDLMPKLLKIGATSLGTSHPILLSS